MLVLGIDPGLRNMGWGLVQKSGSKLLHMGNGVCTSSGDDLASRLLSLHQQLTEIVARFKPDAAAVEQTFVNSNGAATLKLGQARAIALLVPAQYGLTVAEYAPNTIKKVVVGVGHAQKEQVAHMVKTLLGGVVPSGPDAADALAIAICHTHHMQFSARLDAALAKAEAKG